MKYCDIMCLALNKATSSLRLMDEMWEIIMQGKKHLKRFFALGCGGQPCIRIQNHIVGHVTHIKGLVGRHGGMNYL